MKTPLTRRSLLAVAVFFLSIGWTGCNPSVTSRTDVTWNSHRTLTQRSNGVKRILETRDAVVFKNGKIIQLPKGAVVQLSEFQDKGMIVAESRERSGKPELWIKTGNTFTKGTEADNAWLDSFLQALQP